MLGYDLLRCFVLEELSPCDNSFQYNLMIQRHIFSCSLKTDKRNFIIILVSEESAQPFYTSIILSCGMLIAVVKVLMKMNGLDECRYASQRPNTA